MAVSIINKQLKTIDNGISSFVDGLPETERKVFDKVMELVKDLTTADGSIENNAQNIRIIARIKAELEGIVLNNDYLQKVSDFTKVFNDVGNLNSTYFSEIADNFSPKPLLEEIKKLNIDTTVSDLTESGIGSAYTDGIRDLLETNITTGAKYTDLVSGLRDFIIGKDGEDGKLVKYARQISTDALNQYNGQYIKSVSSDLGLNWYMYIGSNLETTRPFCKALTQKKYIHESELSSIVNGNIDGKKVSTAGLYPDTTAANFFQLRGGYNCGHQLYPIPSGLVPKELRDKFQ